jgi:hypothetical protein
MGRLHPCTATSDLPLTLSEGETGAINVMVKISGSSGRFQHAFMLLTDDDAQPQVIAHVSGKVIDSP